MDREEIIQRLKNISEHAVHTVGKQRYIMSLDDGIALCEAAEILEREPSVIDSVLEIIDKIDDYQVIKFGSMAYGDGKDELRRRIL